MEIVYETNIMASAPRKFKCELINLENSSIEKMMSLEPIYNEEKDCY